MNILYLFKFRDSDWNFRVTEKLTVFEENIDYVKRIIILNYI